MTWLKAVLITRQGPFLEAESLFFISEAPRVCMQGTHICGMNIHLSPDYSSLCTSLPACIVSPFMYLYVYVPHVSTCTVSVSGPESVCSQTTPCTSIYPSTSDCKFYPLVQSKPHLISFTIETFLEHQIGLGITMHPLLLGGAGPASLTSHSSSFWTI